MRRLGFIMALGLIGCLPLTALAERFSVQGHELNVTWEHKTNPENQVIFVINGTSTKGSPCRNLEIQIAFSSDLDKDNVPVAKAFIADYDPTRLNTFYRRNRRQNRDRPYPNMGFR